MAGGEFEIYKDQGGHFRFRLKARNGEVVATGESYPPRQPQRRASKPSREPQTMRRW